MLETISKLMEKYGLALAVLVVAFLAVASFSSFGKGNREISRSENPQQMQAKISDKNISNKTQKLSEMSGPSIGDEAAFDERGGEAANSSCQKNLACFSLPAVMWIFLLAAYLALLIFNLGITFGKRETIQWFWEAVLTIFALGAWFWMDGCRTNVWYPLFILMLGILIYLFYLYFFEQKRKLTENDKKQDSLF
jgi:Flp pilus assembly protein TadB